MPFTRRYHLLTTLALLTAAQSSFAIQYTITNLGSLGGGGTRGMALNESGQVAGESYIPPHGPTHAFGTNAATGIINPATDDLGTNGATASYGRAINDSGQVAGYTFAYIASSVERAFRADPGSPMIDLGSLGGTNANAQGINNSGQVVGYSDTGGTVSHQHAFRTAPDALINSLTDDLGDLGGGGSRAYAINNSGQVVGISLATSGISHAFRTTPGGIIDASADLGTLAGFMTYSLGLNNAGDAVGLGYFSSSLSSPYHAFFVPAGRALLPTDDLGTLSGGVISAAAGVNSSDVIVGMGSTGPVGSSTHAIIWYTPGATPIDLNTLIPANSGWELLGAQSINDSGQITGYGYYNGDTTNYAGFVLTVATPEPASLAFLLAAIPFLALRRRQSIAP